MNNDNSFSIDRLVEFGLSLAVAQQMTRSMNHAFSNTLMPGLNSPMNAAPPAAGHFFVAIDGKPVGPFAEEEIARLIGEGKVNKSSHVWRPGMAQWARAENVPEVLKLVALAPPPLPPES